MVRSVAFSESADFMGEITGFERKVSLHVNCQKDAASGQVFTDKDGS